MVCLTDATPGRKWWEGFLLRPDGPLRSVLTEIYLCHTRSCHEILRMETTWTGGRAS
eukprot:COSAG01_NODE_39627_length_474_cov_0.770667_1_plen_56_part_10